MVRDLHISNSNIHGHGVFAKKNFKRGDFIFLIKGKTVKWQVHNLKDSLYGPDWIGINKNTWVDPSGPAKFLNHSCNPNAGIQGKVKITALRDIKKGEEITIDYSITEIDELWHMKCNCGSKACRGTIRSIQFLPKKIYNGYIPYMPTYFKKIYNQHERKNIK